MARTSFLFRTDPKVLDALKKWAEDDLRSVNGQLDFIVRRALKERGRLKPDSDGSGDSEQAGDAS